MGSVYALAPAFRHIPDENKIQALEDIHRLSKDNDNGVRGGAAFAFGQIIDTSLNKTQVWDDLHRLTFDKEGTVRKPAIEALGFAFSHIPIPNKELAWQDVHRLSLDKDGVVRGGAAVAISLTLPYVSDKSQALMDLFKLIDDTDERVRENAIKALKSALLTRKEDDDPINLLGNIRSAVSDSPNKENIWKAIWGFGQEGDGVLRLYAASILDLIIPHITYKNRIFKDLQLLAQDENPLIRGSVAYVIGSAFSYLPDTYQAYRELNRLARDKHHWVRCLTAEAFGSVLSVYRERDQVFNDLHMLSLDENKIVRWGVANSLGSAFAHVQNRDEVLHELLILMHDEEGVVRSSAYYSLGRCSVLVATESKDIKSLKNRLEEAVNYFSKSLKEGLPSSPSKFCHPFYRSYLAIIFESATESEVQNYLIEAKEAVGDSKSKEELLKAVENLAGALRESQKLKEKPVREIADDLKAYRWYCEKAAEHMAIVEDKAPGAVKLLKIGIPIIDERAASEIQEKAKRFCQITTGFGTVYETIGEEIYKDSKSLSSEDFFKTKKFSFEIIKKLEILCKILPEDKRVPVCKAVGNIEQAIEFPNMLEGISDALGLVCSALVPLADVVILTVLPEEYDAVRSQFTCMRSIGGIYAWQLGEINCQMYNCAYKVALGMVGRPGTNESALATSEAIRKWNPKYILFVGIAGGLKELDKGDVFIADVIHGYEYGKIDHSFLPRDNWTFKTHLGLINLAKAYALRSEWRERIKATPPIGHIIPKIASGEIASGDKVIDDPNEKFFAKVLKKWPKLKAVEMEGAGVGNAIEQAGYLGRSIGFMMIRGISDLPRPKKKIDIENIRGTQERDNWKSYAANTAAAFAIGIVANGLPDPPSAQDETLS